MGLDGWILEAGDELMQDRAKSLATRADLFELRIPAKLMFQRGGTSVAAWNRATSAQKKTTVIVTRVVTISDKASLDVSRESLDENWKVTAEVHSDGLSLDIGDELVHEGSLESVKELDDLFEVGLPFKCILRKALKQSGGDTTVVEENGHAVTKTKVTKVTKSGHKTIKGHHHEDLK